MELKNLIHADAIDDVHIVFKCPHHRRITYHRHGSEKSLCNRHTHRSSHCEHLEDYYLVIDDDTVRGTIKNNRILKRSLASMERLHAKQIKNQNK